MRPQPVPPLWALLCGLWQIEEALARVWFHAVAGSTWSDVVQWRQVLLFHETLGDARHCASTLCRPEHLLHIIALLVAEKRLLRKDAARIEDRILARLDGTGDWISQPIEPRGSDG